MMTTLNSASVLRLVQIALAEDIGTGDITSEATIDENTRMTANFLAKQSGVICGLPIVKLVFETLDGTTDIEEFIQEGDFVEAGTVIARVEGTAQTLLKGERTALNFLQRMSGVATMAHTYTEAIKGTEAKVLDTRKTIPAWRLLDKYAVKIGGAENHRFGLFDMAMIKDNHISAAGSITVAIQRVQEMIGSRDVKIEVETKNLVEIEEVLAVGGVHRIMFDNFTPELMTKAVKLVNHRFETEASGNITLQTIRKYAETGVDFISSGALTHSAPALDISMKF